jgi:Glycosyl transferase family 2
MAESCLPKEQGHLMASWGICALIKAPTDQVLAYVAHHQELGAAHAYLYFDDPMDPAADVLENAPGVSVTRCDQTFWKRMAGQRPKLVNRRQRHIIKKFYQACDLDWLLHIDADEFLISDHPIDLLLDQVPPQQPTVRAEPFEALPGDTQKVNRIYRSQHFRRIVTDAALREKLFGSFAPALQEGMVSHRLGKSFFRVGLADMVPKVHNANIGDTTTESQPFDPNLRLLHFHADDVEHFVATAHYKASIGSIRLNPPYANQLLALDDAGLRDFHRRVHACDTATLNLLQAHDALYSIDLGLETKVACLRKRIAKAAARRSGRLSTFRKALRAMIRPKRKAV